MAMELLIQRTAKASQAASFITAMLETWEPLGDVTLMHGEHALDPTQCLSAYSIGHEDVIEVYIQVSTAGMCDTALYSCKAGVAMPN